MIFALVAEELNLVVEIEVLEVFVLQERLFVLIFDEFLASYRAEAVPNKVQHVLLLLLSCTIAVEHCSA